jgi:hypothetical protein
MYRVVIIGLLLLGNTQSYFKYSDCNPDCIHYNSSCTIQEINPQYFLNQCSLDEPTCEEVASSSIVCLRPDGPPLGGEDIWPDFEKHKKPPKPEPRESSCRIYKILAITYTSILSVFIVAKMLSAGIRYLRTSAYESLNSLPENSVYEETTENIE